MLTHFLNPPQSTGGAHTTPVDSENPLPVKLNASVALTAAVSVPNATPGLFDMGGAIILPPGGYCHIWTSAILAASSLLAGFSWEEVPV